jgi:hypothetical protein
LLGPAGNALHAADGAIHAHRTFPCDIRTCTPSG